MSYDLDVLDNGAQCKPSHPSVTWPGCMADTSTNGTTFTACLPTALAPSPPPSCALQRVLAEAEAAASAHAATRLAEEEAQRAAEEAARRAAEEARRAAEEEARRVAEEEARREAKEEARRVAEEEARRAAEEEARRVAEEEARRAAAEAARRAAEEEAEARRLAQEAAAARMGPLQVEATPGKALDTPDRGSRSNSIVSTRTKPARPLLNSQIQDSGGAANIATEEQPSHR